MKTWTSREVILILDFVDFLSEIKSQYRECCIKYYFNELNQAIPEFSNVAYSGFSALINGLCDESLNPTILFEEQANYVNTFRRVQTKHLITEYALDLKKQLKITDCSNAYLSDIWGSSQADECEISIFELKEQGETQEHIDELIDRLLSPPKKEIAEVDVLISEAEEKKEKLSNFERIIRDYLTGKPYFQDITFSDTTHPKATTLPMLYSSTLYLIDKQLSQGNNRITVVMPEASNLMALFAARIIRDEMEGPFDPFENLRGVQPGQKMRIGKAIIQIEEIKEDSFQYLCKDLTCTEVRSDKKTWYQYLEKVEDGSLNRYQKVYDEINRIEAQAKTNSALQILMSNKDAVSKTTVLLTTKISIDEFSKEYYVLGSAFSKVFSIGEFSQDPLGFNSRNKHCEVPNFTIAIELSQIVACASDESIREKIDCVFVTQEKVRELLANRFLFERLMKLNIPVIVFLAETDYERFNELSKYGFSLFHWKPSTLTDKSFIKETEYYTDTVFEDLTKKTNNASKASFKVEVCDGSELRSAYKKIKRLIDMCSEFDRRFQDLVWKIKRINDYLISDYYSTKFNDSENPVLGDIVSVYEDWNGQKSFYNDDIRAAVEGAIESIRIIASKDSTKKFDSLYDLVKEQVKSSDSIAIVVPDQQALSERLQEYYSDLYSNNSCDIYVFSLNQYLTSLKKRLTTFDYVNVLWFDKSDYIRIKNTYSYRHLVYILFPLEEKRRSYFRKGFDDCLQHSKTIMTAGKLGIGDSVQQKPFDETPDSERFDYSEPEVADYESALEKIYGITDDKKIGDDVVSSTLIISRKYRILYLPTHRVIDISEVIANGDRITQKPVQELQRGDYFVVRESDKDIVSEVADGLIGPTANQFRKEVGLWVFCLGMLINEYGFEHVYKVISKKTFCTKQQIRYWSWGETICPDNPMVFEIIANLCKKYPDKECVQFCNNFKAIYEKGKKLQQYHMTAGKKINQQLRKCHKEISDIYNSGGRGYLTGIGNIIIVKVEAIYGNQTVNRTQLNRLEVI